MSATPCSELDKVISSQTWLDLSINSASAVVVRCELERDVLEREVAVRKFSLLFDRQWV